MNQNEDSPKRLLRARDDRYIGGVAAGLARYLSIDPTLVRVAFVASLAFGGLGVLAYIVLLALMPIEGPDDEPLPAISKRRSNLMIAGAVLTGAIVVIGVGSGGFGRWIFGFGPGPLFGILLWSAALIAIVWLGITLLSRDESGAATLDSRTGTGQTPAPPGTVAPSPSQTAPVAAAPGGPGPGEDDESTAATGDEPTGAADDLAVVPSDDPTGVMPSESSTGAGDKPTDVMAGERTDVMPASARTGSPTGAAATEPMPPQRPADKPFGATVGRVMVIIAAGVAALTLLTMLFFFAAWVTAQFGSVPMALLVTVLGAAMVLAAIQGRRHLAVWLLATALTVAVPMAIVTLADLRIDGSYGSVKQSPTRVDEIPAGGYSLAAGRMVVDLRELSFGPDTYLPLKVNSGFGLTSVIVPDRVCVTARMDARAGVIDVRGRESSGIDLTRQINASRRATPQVRLDVDLKVGAVEVIDSTTWENGGAFDERGATRRPVVGAAAARNRADNACVAAPRNKTPQNAREGRGT